MKKSLRGIFVLSIVGIFLLAIVNCSNPNRYNTQKGAAIGAGAGAFIGYLIGGKAGAALLGGLTGGLVGAVVGNAIDQEHQIEAAKEAYRDNKTVVYTTNSKKQVLIAKPERVVRYQNRQCREIVTEIYDNEQLIKRDIITVCPE